MSDIGSGPGQWVQAPDGLTAWRQPDGSLWRRSPDGSWVAVPHHSKPHPWSSDPLERTVHGLREILSNLGTTRLVYVIALAAGFVGLLLSWWNAAFYVSFSLSGVDTGDGKTYGVLLVVALVLVALRTRRRSNPGLAMALVVLPAIMTAVATYDIVREPSFSFFGTSVSSVGLGLYVDAVAGVVALGAGLVDALSGSVRSGD